MKLGMENKKKTWAAVGLLALAVVLLWWTLSSAPSRGPGVAPGAAPAAGPLRAGSAAAKPGARATTKRPLGFSLEPTLDPRLRLDLLRDSEGTVYKGTGRNIFQEHLEDIPTPKAPGLIAGGKAEKPVWIPPRPATPVPINLKFYGWASQAGEPKAIFLAQGDNQYVAYEGDIVARRYKVLRIGPNSVEIEDVLSNNRQSIPLAF